MTTGSVPPLSGPGQPGDDWWEEAAAARDWALADDEARPGSDADTVAGAPPGWREELTAGELAEWYAEMDARPVIADPEAAWFAAGCPSRSADVPAGVSVFSAEEAGESLNPGPELAGLSQQAIEYGLSALTDDALVGVVRASRRLAAWQDGVELAAVAELDARRIAASARPGSSQVSEHVAEELAMALVLTGRSADLLLGLARDLVRLPAVVAGLMEGTIDRARAVVFAEELAGLDQEAARSVADAFLGQAGTLTTGQLRIRIRAMVLLTDPDAARKRAQNARREARVETWQEMSGNGALSGRELPAADMLTADARITAIARALQSAGAAGSLDQVRAAVFCALLAGRDPEALFPAPGPAPGPAPCPAPGSAPGPGGQPGPGFAGIPGSGRTAGAAARSGLAALAGSVHLTLPAATWLGWADAPGELPGYGPVDGWTARDLAARLARHPSTRWHVTLTGPGGRALAHASARISPRWAPRPVAGSGPPGGT
ncbi:MAG: hypothetical protein ACR2FU_05515, partial [Streptosporangiaceae bacterium]